MYLTYTSTCTLCSLQGYHLVIGPVASLRQFVARILHRQSDVDPRASCVSHQRIFLLDEFQQLPAVHRLCHLSLFGLADAGIQDLCNVLLLHVVLVQLLDALHLDVVKPVRSLHLTQFVEHLGIELAVVDVTVVVRQM